MTDTVRVGALTYRVEYDPDLVHQDLDGKITHSDGIIRLRPGMSPQFERMILWHEIVHAVFSNAALDVEENVVRVLAHGIVEVLGANQWLQEAGE